MASDLCGHAWEAGVDGAGAAESAGGHRAPLARRPRITTAARAWRDHSSWRAPGLSDYGDDLVWQKFDSDQDKAAVLAT